MGTPARSLTTLLSPKFISPLSPRLRDTKNYTLSVKKLDFRHFPRTSCSTPSPTKLRVPPLQNRLGEESVKKDILMNTPTKQEITKHGLHKRNLLNILGKGNFGNVVKGIYKDQPVAVKVVKNTEHIIRERNALNLRHPNLVRTLEITESPFDNFSVIIMEYIPESRHLQTFMENIQNISDDMLVRFSKDISFGLQYCHLQGILHLDIKPQNIIVCGEVCKICDFGNSCKIEKTTDFKNNGTIYYTAPELWEGMLPTEKCDIYSLGILFWYMKNRKTPYDDLDNVESVIYQVVKCDLRPDLNIPRSKYAQLYQSCWRKDPSYRPDMSEVVDCLNNMSC